MSDFVPNPRKTPLKGVPDFTRIPDNKLREMKDTVQDLIFAYKYCDEEKTKMLQTIYKQISGNLTDRIKYDKMYHTVVTKDTQRVTIPLRGYTKPRQIKLVAKI